MTDYTENSRGEHWVISGTDSIIQFDDYISTPSLEQKKISRICLPDIWFVLKRGVSFSFNQGKIGLTASPRSMFLFLPRLKSRQKNLWFVGGLKCPLLFLEL